MARLFYGFGGGDVVAQLSSDGDFEPSTSTFDVYTDRTGGTQHTGLLTVAGAAATQVSVAAGTLDAEGRVLFQGQDGYVGTYWLQDTASPTKARWQVNPTKLAEMIAAGVGSGTVTIADITDITLAAIETFLAASTTSDALTALGFSALGTDLVTSPDAADARADLGFSTLGGDLVTSPDAADARADLGSGAVGDAIFVAAAGSTVRTVISAPSQAETDLKIRAIAGGTAFGFGVGTVLPSPSTPGLADGDVFLVIA